MNDAISEPRSGPGTSEQRRKYLGGSDVAAILGLSKWQTPLQLWEKKTGRFVETITPEKQKLFDRGHRWEQPAFEMLCDELESRGHKFEVVARNLRYKDPEFPFLACEIDAELILDGEPVNVEIKTVHPFAQGEWGEQDTEEVPVAYGCQAMFGLMITGKSETLVGALFGADNLAPYFIKRDQETIDTMRAKAVAWWEKHIIGDVAPDPVNMEDMMRLFARKNGRPAEIDEPTFRALEQLNTVRAKMKAFEGDEEELKFKVCDGIRKAWGLAEDSPVDDNAVIRFNGHDVGSWKKQLRNTIDTKRLKAEAPIIAEKYNKESVTRVLRIKL